MVKGIWQNMGPLSLFIFIPNLEQKTSIQYILIVLTCSVTYLPHVSALKPVQHSEGGGILKDAFALESQSIKQRSLCCTSMQRLRCVCFNTRGTQMC